MTLINVLLTCVVVSFSAKCSSISVVVSDQCLSVMLLFDPALAVVFCVAASLS